jgi:DNA-binding NarL/FixJ family response regulator
MKVIIIEDETLSAEHLTTLLHKLNRNIEVVKYLDTVKATIQAFEDGLEADVMFVDIHLADGNSFEIFSKIKSKYLLFLLQLTINMPSKRSNKTVLIIY